MSGSQQLRGLFYSDSSHPVSFCQSLPPPWACMHLMKQSQPSGAHALPLSNSVKQLLFSKWRPLRCSSRGRKATASHRFSKTHHWLVCLSIQPWLCDYKTDFLGYFVWELLVFTAVARGLLNYSPFVTMALQSFSKMVRGSLYNWILRYFKLEVW